MRLALQLELAARRCALRECPWGAVGTRGYDLNPFDNSLIANAPVTTDGTFSFFPNRIFFYSVS